MAYLYRLIVFLIISLPNFVNAQSAPVGAIDLAGWIKGADGIYSKAFSDASGISSKVTLNSPPNSLKTVSTALVNTSKALIPFDIEKTSNLDVGRVGKAVSKFAQRVGPVGMALGTVSLICELTTICNQAGQWMMEPTASPSMPNSYPSSNGQWWGWGTRYYPTVAAACNDTERLTVNIGAGSQYVRSEMVNADVYKCYGNLPAYPGNEYYV